MNHCDFCKKNKTVPKYYLKTILKKIKNNKNKNIFKLFIILNLPYNYIVKYKIYIPLYSKELLYVSRNIINSLYYDVGIIKCSLCNKNACPSHFLWSNFYNGKCKSCTKLISVCGWCNKNICLQCSKS